MYRSPAHKATHFAPQERCDTLNTLGDNAYQSGKLSEFNNCYDPTWGAAGGSFLNRTHPALGNHEYADAATSSASGYFDYFVGRVAMTGSRGEGYYAYDVGPNWMAISLNSNPKTASDLAPGCNSDACGTAQMDFLKAELAGAETKNVIAYFHHARFSDGPHGSTGAAALRNSSTYYTRQRPTWCSWATTTFTSA